VGLQGKEKNLPSELSGGQQQRVSVARAVAHNPKVIFADEPTANLDSFSGKQVIELFRELNKAGQTIVMVTHEEEYGRLADRIIELSDGQIVNYGH
jgi:ABC-type lipoprotein export system ATPase subunit